MFWEINSLLFIKEIIEIEIFRFFNFFSKIWKIGEKYKADRIGDKAEPYTTPILILKKEEEKLFQRYFIFLSTIMTLDLA